MKLKYLIPLFVMILIKITHAGEDSIYHYSFLENSGTYVFGDNVRVRKSPVISDSNIIDQLTIGDKVTIVSRSEQTMVIDGYKENWYKIIYRKKDKDLSGYTWGGFLAIGFSVKGEKLFLAGIKKYNADSGFTAECRLVEKGRMLSSAAFEPHYLNDGSGDGSYGYAVTTELKGGQGLEGIENIFRIFFNYEACGYPRGNVWIGYGKDKLYYIGKDSSVSEAGVFHVEEKFIFPVENKSVKDMVILVNESYDFDESKNDYKLTERKESKFTWRDFKLVPVK